MRQHTHAISCPLNKQSNEAQYSQRAIPADSLVTICASTCTTRVELLHCGRVRTSQMHLDRSWQLRRGIGKRNWKAAPKLAWRLLDHPTYVCLSRRIAGLRYSNVSNINPPYQPVDVMTRYCWAYCIFSM